MLNEEATKLAGEPLEAFEFLQERQRFTAEGPVVSWAALDLLAAVGNRGRVPRPERGSAPFAELAAAALVDDRGALTDAGMSVRGHWATGRTVLEIDRRVTSPGRLSAWANHGTVLVAASAPAFGPAFDRDRVQLGVVPTERALPAIAAWVQLRPTWSFTDGPTRLDRGVYEERLRAITVPPRDAPPHLVRAWARPWVEYRSASPQRSLRFVDAADSGFFSVVLSDHDAVIDALPSRSLFTALLGQFADAL